jgi:hypothetical protein
MHTHTLLVRHQCGTVQDARGIADARGSVLESSILYAVNQTTTLRLISTDVSSTACPSVASRCAVVRHSSALLRGARPARVVVFCRAGWVHRTVCAWEGYGGVALHDL